LRSFEETPFRVLSLTSDSFDAEVAEEDLKAMKYWLISGVLLTALSMCMAQQQPDNTKTNQQTQPSADQANNGRSDVKMTAQIRREIVKDKSLSTYAHNVKIIVSGGKVTLRGPVKSDEEKSAIEQKATAIAGAGNVTDELTVKGQS
jgi:osmotically-inducible protein OsmY